MSTRVGESVKVELVYSFKTARGERQVVKMGDFENKMIVIKNKRKFYEEKGSKRLPIYIDDDLTPEERDV